MTQAVKRELTARRENELLTAKEVNVSLVVGSFFTALTILAFIVA